MRKVVPDLAAVCVLEAPDPVEAVLRADREARPIALPTSGSTGTARSVVRTTDSWTASFAAVTDLVGLSTRSRVWIPGPLTASMNLFAAVHAAWLGAARAARISGASHAYLTPGMLARLLAQEPSAVTGVHLVVAGDRLPTGLSERATAAGARVSHYYGAAELSYVAWGSHEDDLRPFPGVEVTTSGGVVWVRSPFVCRGYTGSPGPLRLERDGWASVGDRGALHGGYLRVQGRGPEWVTTGGATVSVTEVEQVLRRRCRGVVYLLGVPHPSVGAVLVGVLTDATDLDGLRARARTELSPAQRPRRWYHLHQVPLTAAGKVDRAALASLLASPEQSARSLV